MKNNKLIIVGNGFDLCHELKTGYIDFINHVDNPILNSFKEYCNENSQISKWYDFENNIKFFSQKTFDAEIRNEDDYYQNQEEWQDIDGLFKEISILLMNYLKTINTKSIEKKTSLIELFSDNAPVISFNYTDTLENYTGKENIFYIHGSLAENDIILGYDVDEEPCIAQYEDIKWNKQLLRENLAFHRLLRKRGIQNNTVEYSKYIEQLEIFQQDANSGKGYDDEVEENKPEYKLVRDCIVNDFVKPLYRPAIDYGKIENIYIVGHGLEADRVYLHKLLGFCSKLQNIFIYTFDGEKKEDYDEKERFFEFCHCNVNRLNY